jgi:2-polyprenyl-3-methyl-5-hydroxy-6-metoxy-1,4-benzoquinol methylase
MDTNEYWLNRGSVYRAEFKRHSPITLFRFWQQERAIKQELKKLQGVRTILEIGCGFGRVTRLLLEIPGVERVVATDLSPDQIASAKGNIRDPRAEFRIVSVLDLDYFKEFDLVIASEVLMHIPPEQIQRALSCMENASKKHIISIDWYAPEEDTVAGGYCWQHEYPGKILRKLNRQAIRELSANR